MTEIIYILITLLLAELTKVGLIILSPIISSKIAPKIKSNRIVRIMFDMVITFTFIYLLLIITEITVTVTSKQVILIFIIIVLVKFFTITEDLVDRVLKVYEDDE